MLKIILKLLVISMYTPIVIDTVKQVHETANRYVSNLNVKNNIKIYVKETLSKCKCSVCEQNRQRGIKPIH